MATSSSLNSASSSSLGPGAELTWAPCAVPPLPAFGHQAQGQQLHWTSELHNLQLSAKLLLDATVPEGAKRGTQNCWLDQPRMAEVECLRFPATPQLRRAGRCSGWLMRHPILGAALQSSDRMDMPLRQVPSASAARSPAPKLLPVASRASGSFSRGAASVPPVLPGGVLRKLAEQEVVLDATDGSIVGASSDLSLGKATRQFLQTFDICTDASPAQPSAHRTEFAMSARVGSLDRRASQASLGASFRAASVPPLLQGGVLRGAKGQEVLLDATDGSIVGASHDLALPVGSPSRRFLQTFDICTDSGEAPVRSLDHAGRFSDVHEYIHAQTRPHPDSLGSAALARSARSAASVPPVLRDGVLWDAAGQGVFLNAADGSIVGASLDSFLRPGSPSRRFLQSFDICTDSGEAHAVPPRALNRPHPEPLSSSALAGSSRLASVSAFPSAASVPPVLRGGVLRTFDGKEVLLDAVDGSIEGASPDRPLHPGSPSRRFLQTLDINVDSCEAFPSVSPGSASLPRVLREGVLQGVAGQEVLLDATDGSIAGASFDLTIKPGSPSRRFLQTFDIRTDSDKAPDLSAPAQTRPQPAPLGSAAMVGSPSRRFLQTFDICTDSAQASDRLGPASARPHPAPFGSAATARSATAAALSTPHSAGSVPQVLRGGVLRAITGQDVVLDTIDGSIAGASHDLTLHPGSPSRRSLQALAIRTNSDQPLPSVSPSAASIPPVLRGAVLQSLAGQEVLLDTIDGSIAGASLDCTVRPGSPSRQFLQTFDICTDSGRVPVVQRPAPASIRPEPSTAPTVGSADISGSASDELLALVKELVQAHRSAAPSSAPQASSQSVAQARESEKSAAAATEAAERAAAAAERAASAATMAAQQLSELSKTQQVAAASEQPRKTERQLSISPRPSARSSPRAASIPSVLPQGVIRGLSGQEVFLDEADGSIAGASLDLSLLPEKTDRQFLQTFDICADLPESSQAGGQQGATSPQDSQSQAVKPQPGTQTSGCHDAASQTPVTVQCAPLHQDFASAFQIPRFVAPGAASVPAVMPSGVIRGLLGQDVLLDEADGSITGASLWMSMRPPQAGRRYLHTMDICLPWAEAVAPPPESSAHVPLADSSGHAPLAESSKHVQPDTLPRSPSASAVVSPSAFAVIAVDQCVATPRSSADLSSFSPSPEVTPQRPARGRLDDELSPEQVLTRISGLMREMNAMEASLGNLRDEIEKDVEESPLDLSHRDAAFMRIQESHHEPAPALPRRSRLRSRLPAALAWLEDVSAAGVAHASARTGAGAAASPRPAPANARAKSAARWRPLSKGGTAHGASARNYSTASRVKSARAHSLLAAARTQAAGPEWRSC
eukprot:TRINITY_DN20453_c0_g1_i2.p1 TRINITY_DN20453_c0_g1~~TRINITY_DN20453_c0_g1_i2.p1  ORF type:complete len:1406 (-),score=194.60 TRINITY_DN20453_c0_g1_i2:140-4204(-)